MSWSTMALELSGQTPCPYLLCLTLVNRAWKDVQREYLWSFLWLDFAIPTPSQTLAGTVTTTIGSTHVVGDATAAASWLTIPLSTPITSQQFRIGTGTIYNIIAFDGVNTITLDRLYVDPSHGAGQGYQIYGIYFHAPVKNFVWFDTIRDPITGYALKTCTTRQEADDSDPQRLQFTFPDSVLPYKVDLTAGSFYGFPMYEMWPAPTTGITYVAEGLLTALAFDNTVPGTSDSVTPPLDEDVVMEKAKEKAYEWCMANPDKLPPAARKVDFSYLMGKTQAEFKRLINQYILADEYASKRHQIPYAEMRDYLPQIPWVDQAADTAIFPG